MRPARRAEDRPTVHRATTTVSAAGVSTQQTRHSVRRRTRTRHVHETCAPSGGTAHSAPRSTTVRAAGVSTQQTRHSVRRRRCSGRTPRRIAACRSCQRRSSGSRSGRRDVAAAASRDCAGMQKGNAALQRWRCAATDAAACDCRWSDAAGGASLQAALRCNHFRLSGWAQSRGTLGVL